MVIATSVKALLVTAVTVMSLWRVATPAAGMFALSAHVVESELILILTLPAVCVRLTTHLTEELTDLEAFASCEGCAPHSSRQDWA